MINMKSVPNGSCFLFFLMNVNQSIPTNCKIILFLSNEQINVRKIEATDYEKARKSKMRENWDLFLRPGLSSGSIS